MLFILYQRFFIFIILPDYDTVITKLFFVPMLDSEGYFLTINVVVGRSCPRRIVNLAGRHANSMCLQKSC